VTAYQQIDQIAEGNADRLTVFDMGELQHSDIDQKCGDQLKIDFDRDNCVAVAVAFSGAASADGIGHGLSSRLKLHPSGSGPAAISWSQPENGGFFASFASLASFAFVFNGSGVTQAASRASQLSA